MKSHKISKTIEHIKQFAKRRKRWRNVVAVMAVIVAMGTIYTLSLPAVTMESTALQTVNHVHDESCYGEDGSVVCIVSDENGTTEPVNENTPVTQLLEPDPSPEATEAPEETPVPEATVTPEETPAPEATEAPEEIPVPEATEAPEEIPVPEATEAPEETPAPEATEAPEETPAPEATEAPEETPAPEVTEAPESTPAPEELICDAAYIDQLTVGAAYIYGMEAPQEDAEFTVKNGETMVLPFTAVINVCNEGTLPDDSRIKLEAVIPFRAEKAEFALTDMLWLDNTPGYEPVVLSETRNIDGEDVDCQVLTAYGVIPAEKDALSVPCAFAAEIAVNILDIYNDISFAVEISAIMENNSTDEICEIHNTQEKKTVYSQDVTVTVPVVDLTCYDNYLAEVVQTLETVDVAEEEIWAAKASLTDRMKQSYYDGMLTFAQFDELYRMMFDNVVPKIGEQATGVAWMIQRDKWLAENGGVAPNVAADPDPQEKPAVLKSARAVSGIQFIPAVLDDTTSGSNKQVVNAGGTNVSNDGITVSKTIEGTGLENIFDITLQVQMQEKIAEIYSEPDMAVVIVMDISQTMNDNIAGTSKTRYEAAIPAAEEFMEQFEAYAGDVSKIGFVAFNSDAHEIFPLQTCESRAKLESLKDDMKKDTGDIINNYHCDENGTCDDHQRFTNIEAGLKMAKDMLSNASVKNKNKYIIFLSDGFPTTYIKSGYDGYCTYENNKTHSATICESRNDGIQFKDKVRGKDCIYGTSYSDTAAVKARQQATDIKNAGIKVFSIGVDIGGQTIQQYIENAISKDNNGKWNVESDKKTPKWSSHSIVECGEGTLTYNKSTSPYKPVYNYNFELGSATDPQAFKNWLKNSIGSGYYYDSHSIDDLTDAFEDIFEKIREFNAQSAHLDWIASDPMPEMNEGAGHDVEFIGFYDIYQQLVNTDLTGSSGEIGTAATPFENTAAFDAATQTIQWDIKQSGYYALGTEDQKTYLVSLKYRIRLLNEAEEFVEAQTYNTNDTTTLDYRTIEVVNGNKFVSDKKTISFPIPAVKGWLGELQFTKIDSFDRTVEGAEFTLAHDTASCTVCRGDGTAVTTIADQTTVSDADGNVKFTGIPSGHTYALTETVIPTGFQSNGYTYQVVIAYDEVTVTAKDGSGNPMPWEGTIVNVTYYELPSTGGSGTHRFTLSGRALITGAACLIYVKNFHKKKVC